MTLTTVDEVDLLVFGSGAAGLMTALVATSRGLTVCLCEKTSQLGGTTATSGGTIWVPGNALGGALPAPDTLANARTYLNGEIGAVDTELREAFFAGVTGALQFLEEHSAVRFKANNPYPDYHSDRPGAARAGRALTPLPFDGRRLGTYFRYVRPPIDEYMVLGGMMVGRDEIPSLVRPWASFAALKTALRLTARYALDRLRYPRGTKLYLGNALVGALVLSLREHGCIIQRDTALVSLVVDERRRVTGAVVDHKGTHRTIRARAGVVLATGGFASDQDLRELLIARSEVTHSAAFEGDTGDGLRAGASLGAAIDRNHASPSFWMPVSLLKRPSGKLTVYPHIRDRPKPGIIAVNTSGKRFVNEAASYHDFCLAMLGQSPTSANSPAYLICDRAFIWNYGIGMINPVWQRLSYYTKAGYLVSAPTIEALAGKLGIEPANLARTVAQQNRYAETGVDEEFGKGSTEYQRFNGDRQRKPNPCLAPIDRPPYFAVAIRPAPIGTSVGLATNSDGCVLDDNGTPIAGLYAAGNDMSSIMRGAYPGPGITLGPHLAFAFRTAESISAAASAP
jgi:3-oxosteroid 1-dehydrogenase